MIGTGIWNITNPSSYFAVDCCLIYEQLKGDTCFNSVMFLWKCTLWWILNAVWGSRSTVCFFCWTVGFNVILRNTTAVRFVCRTVRFNIMLGNTTAVCFVCRTVGCNIMLGNTTAVCFVCRAVGFNIMSGNTTAVCFVCRAVGCNGTLQSWSFFYLNEFQHQKIVPFN